MNLHLPRKSILLCAGFAGLFVALGSFHPAAQPRQVEQVAPTPPQIRPTKHSDDPPSPAEFGAASAETPAEVDRRQRREGRYKGVYPFLTDPGKLVNGQQETYYKRFNEYFGRPEPLPSSAVAVITGTVVRGQSHVSADRTLVYSDYAVRLDQIWKPDNNAKLSSGGQVVVWRAGGSVQFPSGHLTHYIIMGLGFPKIGSQYVFFLGRPDSNVSEYEVLSAYEIKGTNVYPLDAYAPELEGADLSAFLAKVKEAISGAGR